MKRRSKLLLLALAALAIGVAGSLGAGWWLGRPYRVAMGPPPADLAAERVTVASASGSELRGWLVPPRSDAGSVAGAAGAPAAARGAILVLHGLHSSKRAMVPRARFLARAGYAVLLLDTQAQGESPGERITFGSLEARDAEAGLAELEQRYPDRPLGAIGVSMGGVALVLSKRPLPLRALVVESMYPTLEQATKRRLRRFLGPPGPWLAPLLLVQMKWRTGISPDDLRPIDHVASVGCPLLILHGSADLSTPLDEARELLAAAREPKVLVEFPGAAHVDLHDFAPAEYEERVLAFFERHLR